MMSGSEARAHRSTVTLHVVSSLAPVLLGEGLSLFGDAGTETRWRLKDVVAYKTGFVELVYGRAKDHDGV